MEMEELSRLLSSIGVHLVRTWTDGQTVTPDGSRFQELLLQVRVPVARPVPAGNRAAISKFQGRKG